MADGLSSIFIFLFIIKNILLHRHIIGLVSKIILKCDMNHLDYEKKREEERRREKKREEERRTFLFYFPRVFLFY